VGRVVAAIVALLVVFAPSTAFADPAGPTDYLSEIRDIDPPTPSIEVAVLGGDSFVELTVEPGTEVTVAGYRSGDQYLWFRADGAVLENQNSPSTYLNDDRFASVDPPPNADADAAPDWQEVASDGRYSWHDHRAHWMQPIRPAGKQVGDQIVEGVIPLVVDGAEVDVTVISTWQAEPSRVAAIAGALISIGLAGFATWRWRSRTTWMVSVVPIAAVALVAGVAQFTSLPSETGPRLAWIALPVIALVAAVAGAVGEQRSALFLARGAVLVAAAQLLVWGLVKRDGLTAAIVPTGAPGWFDRFATAGALFGGLMFGAFALWTLFAPPPRIEPSTRS